VQEKKRKRFDLSPDPKMAAARGGVKRYKFKSFLFDRSSPPMICDFYSSSSFLKHSDPSLKPVKQQQ